MHKGFTLIELLAVIVILAVIALIAVPIVLNMIKESEESAAIRSADFYLDAVEYAIIRQNMKSASNFAPEECIINDDGNVTCDGTYLEIEVDGKKPTSGVITFEEGKVKDVNLVLGDTKIMMDILDQLATSETAKICMPVNSSTKTTGNIPEGNFNPGDEYICEVKPGTKYHFFILSVEKDKVNLILDRNINSDGTLATTRIIKTEQTNDIYNMESWINLEDYVEAGGNSSNFEIGKGRTEKGPISAINFLNKATSSWSNIENLNEVYEDENTTNNGSKGTLGYGNITLTGKARLPKYSEVTAAGADCLFINANGEDNSGIGSCQLWLINNSYIFSSVKSSYYPMASTENFDDSYIGYWILPSYSVGYTNAWYVYTGNGAITYTSSNSLASNQKRGIRPVITLLKDNIS